MKNGSEKEFRSRIFTASAFIATLILYLTQVSLSNETEQTGRAHLNWTSFSAGYAHTNDPYGYSLSLSHSRLFGIHEVTLRVVHFNEAPHVFDSPPDMYAFDIGLLYGPCWTPTISYRENEGMQKRWLSMSLAISAGIAAIFGVTEGEVLSDNPSFSTAHAGKRFALIGFPVKAELRFIPTSRFSFGISGQVNFNRQEPFIAAMLGAQYGLMRSDKELQRAKEKIKIWHDLSVPQRRKKIIARTLVGIAALTCGSISLVNHLDAIDSQGAADDYLEIGDDAMYNEEIEYIRSRRVLRNVFGGCFLAGTTMFAIVFEL